MFKKYFKLAVNIPSIIWLIAKWLSIAWIENFITPALEKISSWTGVPMPYIEGILIGGILVGSIWWLSNELRGNKGRIGESSNTDVLEGIKSDLVALSYCEREVAVARTKTPCPNGTIIRINDDVSSTMFGVNAVETLRVILQEIINKDSIDPVIVYLRKFGDILDMNRYGLKEGLEQSDVYKSHRTNLAQKRLKLKMSRKKKRIVQGNIDRVRSLSYGLSSTELLRSILDSVSEAERRTSVKARVALEGVETIAERILNTALNDLENEWKISNETRKGVETILQVLSTIEGVPEK